MGKIDDRLAELGIELPDVPAAAGAYEAGVRTGNLLFLSGGISIEAGGGSVLGRLGGGLSVEDGQRAARMCLLGRLAVIRGALGSLDAVRRIVAIHGFVNCTPDFEDHPAVIDGASKLAIEIFGDAGRHSRTAIGCASLPRGVAVEISMVVEVAE